ncbi:MAG: DUF763 domain-containing protein [Candidatus Omnitrophica bacterium]|nr:DUF763 domain-containing protein [Candidatus Omnitrophota bacterium]
MSRKRTGIASLPLHGGKAPRWLFERMVRLAREISRVACTEIGRKEFLNKLSDPHWFQAFGCVLGFDWHSSGLTTTVCGALKEALRGLEKELGIYACGGKGGTSRKTPDEIRKLADRCLINKDPEELIYASRISAKVDNTALQDGYQLYHHTFLCEKDGSWVVVQQGMNSDTRRARRYHWLGDEVSDFVCEPHKAICCDNKGTMLNMVSKESKQARDRTTEISRMSPEKTIKEYRKIEKLTLKARHEVKLEDIKSDNLYKILLSTYEEKAQDFETLLGIRGVGPKTIRALALMSELIYGNKPSFEDPARFSFALGGKDGHPYPVNRTAYDESIKFLKDAVSKSKIGLTEKTNVFKRLSYFNLV